VERPNCGRSTSNFLQVGPAATVRVAASAGHAQGAGGRPNLKLKEAGFAFRWIASALEKMENNLAVL